MIFGPIVCNIDWNVAFHVHLLERGKQQREVDWDLFNIL